MGQYSTPEQRRKYVADHRARRRARGECEARTWLDAGTLARVDCIARNQGETRDRVLAALIKAAIEEP